jgi:hypothetical protein
MVLTPDLFHVLRIYSDALDIIEKHDLIKDENGAWIWIRGSFKKVRSMTRAEREIDRLGLEFLTALKKTKETGVWYLLPDDLREILNEIPNPAVVWNEKDNKRRRRLTHAYERQLGSFRDGVRNALDIKTL